MKLKLPKAFPDDMDVILVAGMSGDNLIVGFHGPPAEAGVFGIWLADFLHHYLLNLALEPGTQAYYKAKWEAVDIFMKECRSPTKGMDLVGDHRDKDYS